jgi:hypothetical protein
MVNLSGGSKIPRKLFHRDNERGFSALHARSSDFFLYEFLRIIKKTLDFSSCAELNALKFGVFYSKGQASFPIREEAMIQVSDHQGGYEWVLEIRST